MPYVAGRALPQGMRRSRNAIGNSHAVSLVSRTSLAGLRFTFNIGIGPVLLYVVASPAPTY